MTRIRIAGVLCLLTVALWALYSHGQDGTGTVTDVGGIVATNAPVDAGADEEITRGMALVLKLKQGGMTMIALLAVSIFGVASAIERLFCLNRRAIVPPRISDRALSLWREGKYDEIQAMEHRNKSALARTLAVIARHPTMGLTEVSTLAGDVASRELRRHLQRAYPLAIVATLSPLLGLLGTVIGMIGAFDKVAAAGSLGDASMLGGDISKALITTATGLCIAVPALALYHFFKSKTNMYGMLLEEEVGELITRWFAADRTAQEGGHEG